MRTVTLAQSTTAARSAPVVAAICAAEILSLAGFSIIPALLPQFIDAWSLTNTQAGWLAGMVSAGYMLAVIPLVRLTDRRPARQISSGWPWMSGGNFYRANFFEANLENAFLVGSKYERASDDGRL